MGVESIGLKKRGIEWIRTIIKILAEPCLAVQPRCRYILTAVRTQLVVEFHHQLSILFRIFFRVVAKIIDNGMMNVVRF